MVSWLWKNWKRKICSSDERRWRGNATLSHGSYPDQKHWNFSKHLEQAHTKPIRWLPSPQHSLLLSQQGSPVLPRGRRRPAGLPSKYQQREMVPVWTGSQRTVSCAWLPWTENSFYLHSWCGSSKAESCPGCY